jgi:hypothetical protein
VARARCAIRRGALTAAIDAIEHIDDSFGKFGEQFRVHEQAYLSLLRSYIDRPVMLRDARALIIERHQIPRAIGHRARNRRVRIIAAILPHGGLPPTLRDDDRAIA